MTAKKSISLPFRNSLSKSLYIPPKNSHKGQNGRLLIIGGSRQYHGAPVFSILAARRFVDLIYFYAPDKDRDLISTVKLIPEVIVVNDRKLMGEVDCVLFGIGLGKAKFPITRLKAAKRLVIDGDGLKRIKGKLPKGAILTPHEGEFQLLFGIPGTKENVQKMAKKHQCTILKKDPKGDIISDGDLVAINTIHNQGMTRGGTGDVLSGFVAALYCKNKAFESALSAAQVTGYAGNLCRKKFGLTFSATDLANELVVAYKKLAK